MTDQHEYQHSVKFIPEKCKGCTHCLRACPTGAIRVREGEARMIEDRCITCGECIRSCPHGAIVTNSDNLQELESFAHTVAIATSPFFGQFEDNVTPGRIVHALSRIGFDEVFEETIGVEILNWAIGEEIKKKKRGGKIEGPLISSSCPAIVRLIQVKFPSLTDNVLSLNSPSEITAALVLEGKDEIEREKLGLFSIAPCPARVTAGRAPVGREESFLDRVISIEEAYNAVMGVLPDLDDYEESPKVTIKGLNLGRKEGEHESLNQNHKTISVNGLRPVNRILTDLEEGRLQDIEYVEVNSCVEGCAGGVLTSENPPITEYRLRNMKRNSADQELEYDLEEIKEMYQRGLFSLNKEIEPRPNLHLHDDLQEAISIMEKSEEINDRLPGLDCAACGSPNCKAFAEDVAKGEIDISKCPLLNEKEQKEG